MYKSEVAFLQALEKKVVAERRLVSSEILPSWLRWLGEWLVVNPWRVLVPISGLVYAFLRFLFGGSWVEFILALFGGF